MKLRPLRRTIWWLLPIVLARSLVPGGFMLSVADHGLDIVMCSGLGLVPVAEDSGQHAHHSTHAQDQNGGDEGKDHAPCPYALSGSAYLAGTWATADASTPVAANVVFHTEVVRSAEPYLLDRIRGPPLA